MSLTRRRSDRHAPARRRRWSSLETLEAREMLSGFGTDYYAPSVSDLPVQTGAVNLPPAQGANHPLGISNAEVNSLGNEGKVVTGRDRAGNVYSIAVYGPGEVIVTDATPNDGVLDDDIDSIQLVGTDPNRTHVIGSTSASIYTETNGEVRFNRLISQNGVASIVLNGFVLSETVAPFNAGLPNSDTGVYLPGGVKQLQFTGVTESADTSIQTLPLNIVIGDPNIPLRVKPSVRIDEISNTVFDSTTSVVPLTPNTVPTVNIIINGEAGKLQFVSAGQATVPAAEQYLFPIVGTTGRTSIQVKGIDKLSFVGSATNVTASQTSTPFQPGFSGLSHLGSASFGGNADGLGLDVAGKVGSLTFYRGLGNPTGVLKAATTFGTPAANIGFAGNGLLGGLVRASSIGSITAAPGDVTLLTSNNPFLIQQYRNGSTTYHAKAGRTLNNAAIATSGNIGSVHVVGDSTTSEIKAGFNLLSYTQGIQGTRANAKIGHITYRGDLVNSVVSASFQPGTNGYGFPGSVSANGSLAGNFNGSIYFTGQVTALGNKGTGFYAAHKSGYLPSL